MNVIFDWNLGNMIYNGLITLRCYGFPLVEIGVVSMRAAQKSWPTPTTTEEQLLELVSDGLI